jgi:hypothetical protein
MEAMVVADGVTVLIIVEGFNFVLAIIDVSIARVLVKGAIEVEPVLVCGIFVVDIADV